jgi:hypothetical protein
MIAILFFSALFVLMNAQQMMSHDSGNMMLNKEMMQGKCGQDCYFYNVFPNRFNKQIFIAIQAKLACFSTKKKNKNFLYSF